MVEELIHIHALAGDVCVACGDADDGVNKFTTDTGYWNQLGNSRCTTSTMVKSDYSLFQRDDPRTSALPLKRRTNPKRTDRSN